MRISDWSSDVCSSDLPDDGKWALKERPGFLRLHATQADGIWTARNTLTQKAQGPKMRAVTKLDTTRSAEHTSELHSLMRISYAVLCLKTKTQDKDINGHHSTMTRDTCGTTTSETLT